MLDTCTSLHPSQLLCAAGLIFLSAMATSIADEGKAAGKSSGVILGTALLTTAVATVLVGICIILVGDCPSQC